MPAPRPPVPEPSRPSGPVLLSGAEVTALMRPVDWLAAAEAAFRALAEGRGASPPPLHVRTATGGFHAKAGLLRDEPFFALKLNGNFPGNPQRGLPTVQGVLLLCDADDGHVLAVIDSAEVTLQRTAAAAALAADRLARPGADSVAVCGCGAQGAATLAMLAAVLPLKRARLWDADPGKAQALARYAAAFIETEAAPDLRSATRLSDVVVACTTARRAYLGREDVRPGAFIAALGADNPEKSEVEPALMANARIVTDSTAQCAEMGDLRAALAAGAIGDAGTCSELGDVLAGRVAGRRSADDIVVFDSTGLGVQDLAAAITILGRCKGREVRRL